MNLTSSVPSSVTTTSRLPPLRPNEVKNARPGAQSLSHSLFSRIRLPFHPYIHCWKYIHIVEALESEQRRCIGVLLEICIPSSKYQKSKTRRSSDFVRLTYCHPQFRKSAMTTILDGRHELFDQSAALTDFLGRLIPSIEGNLQFVVAAEIFIWNHYRECEHISAKSLSAYFLRVYFIKIKPCVFAEILTKVNLIARDDPRGAREFKNEAHNYHDHFLPLRSKHKNLYKEWSRFQDEEEEEEQEKFARDARGQRRESRHATSERRETSHTYGNRFSRERMPEKVKVYYKEPRRSSEYRYSRTKQRESYNVVTVEPGMSSRTARPWEIDRQERRRPARSPCYSSRDDSGPTVVVVEPGMSSRTTHPRDAHRRERRRPTRPPSYSSDSDDSGPTIVVVEPRRRR